MDTGKQKNIQKNVLKLMKTFESEGFNCDLVGGAVRDILMGETPKDWDIATNAKWYETLKIFPNAKIVSEPMSVVKIFLKESQKVTEVDVATFREETYGTCYGRPDRVIFLDNIDADLKRRDFTINAMAMESAGNICDSYGGMADIENKVLRFVGDGRFRLTEDPVRMLRGIRMISEKNSEPESETKKAIYEKAELVKYIGGERVGAELLGIAKGQYRKKAFIALLDTGILENIFDAKLLPEKKRHLTELIKRDNRENKKRQAEDSEAACNFPDEKINLAIILTWFLKETECEIKTFVEKVLEMSFEKEFSNELIKTFMYIEELAETDSSKNLKNFISGSGEKIYIFIEEVLRKGRFTWDDPALEAKREKRCLMYKEIKENKEAIFIKDLRTDGKMLNERIGIKGRKIGETLNFLLEKVHENNKLNNEDALIELAEEYCRNKEE